MALGCGSCNLCCKLLGVPDINKPARMLCWWTRVHGGCQRHHEKDSDPSLLSCAQFKCLWLESQDYPDLTKRLPRHFRPDISHVVIGPVNHNDDTMSYVQVDPEYPSSWLRPEMRNYLDGIIARGGRLEIITGDDVHIELGANGVGTAVSNAV